MTINSAQPELLALATAMRGEEWAGDLAGALAAAHNAGWDWPRAFRYATRLMADEEALPRDMAEAARDPLKPAVAAGAAPAAVAPVLDEVRAKAAAAAAVLKAGDPS